MTVSTTLEAALPPRLRTLKLNRDQQSIPALAKDPHSTAQIRELLKGVETTHEVILGDARETQIPHSSVHLVVTSPPYWTLKEYPDTDGQMGRIGNYRAFLDNLDRVWRHCYRALVPGGRLVCVVGDVCLSRRQNGGRHTVIPLHAAIQMRCCKIGFDNLAPIVWHKISNLKTEANGSGSYLGKPYEPNGVIKTTLSSSSCFGNRGAIEIRAMLRVF